MALTKNKGLDGHSKACSHINTEKAWDEHVTRKNKGNFVATMVHKRIPDHKILMEAVFNVFKFLSSNTDFRSGDVYGGVYLNAFSQILL